MNKIIVGKYYGYYMPNHHLANKAGLVYEHELIAENEILHRPLRNGEVIHHIDENKLNNSIDNLMVFATKSDHTAFHKGLKATFLENEGVYVCEGKATCICPIYGKSKKRKSKMCISCRNKIGRDFSRERYDEEHSIIIDTNKLNHPIKYDKEIIDYVYNKIRDELKLHLLKRNFTEIARFFSVTDNAVRKWCKKYNLPFKTSEILKMTDEEILNL